MLNIAAARNDASGSGVVTARTLKRVQTMCW